MPYSCTHMPTVGVKLLMWSELYCSLLGVYFWVEQCTFLFFCSFYFSLWKSDCFDFTRSSFIATVCHCRDWNKRISADQARATFEHSLRLDQEFGTSFTGAFHLLSLSLSH